MQLTLVSFLSICSLTFAQSASQTTSFTSALPSPSASSNATSTSNGPQTHTIAVGKAGNTFSPDVVLANVGDIIEYDFYPINHSVARAEYLYPCVPYELTGVDKVGFFSGFEPVDAILANPPKYQIRVNDSNPIFYYCTAPGSCIGYGMIGVINPNASTSLSLQRQLAENSTFMLVPGQNWPSESQDPFATTSSSAAPSSTASPTHAATAPAATTPAPPPSSQNTLGAGAIAGITIGAAAIALLAGALIYMCGRQSRKPVPQAFSDQFGNVTYLAQTPKHMSTVYSDPRTSVVYHPHGIPSYSLAPQHETATSHTSPSIHPASPVMTESIQPAPVYPGPSTQSAAAVAAEAAPPPEGVHEMPGTEQKGGVLGFLRSNSMRKSGGVERYG